MIVRTAHAEQTDKAGMPYILHPMRVADSLRYSKQKTIALLHDVLEDTWVDEELLHRFFPDDVCNAVVTLTRKDGESYMEYIARIIESGDEDIIMVKIADLNDNMNLGRLETVTDEDVERTKKYAKAKKRLKEYLDNKYL